MYKRIVPSTTTLEVNDSYEGEAIEVKVRRIVNQNEPITDGAPRIYTERKDGVKAEYNIRTDRFELAVMATEHMAKEHLAKRTERISKESGGAESIPATGENNT